MHVSKTRSQSLLSPAVMIAALGYFVDIFDLLLFSIVRRPSLQSLGVPPDQLVTTGLILHNTQMAGMLVGGILWGILGDKRGRLSVLFGSIFLYSIANLANAYVQSVGWYAVLRLIAGLGLAGELGAGITLVSECLPKEKRGYGTMIVATVGVTGAVVAGLLAEFFDWRTTYLIGGGLGLALLFLRVGVAESGIFSDLKEKAVTRGDFLSLFRDQAKLLRFVNCILIGAPIWFVIGTLIQFSPEFAAAFGVQGSITSGRAIAFCYTGLVLGDFASGFLSQKLRSRNRVVKLFLGLVGVGMIVFFTLNYGAQALTYYWVCLFLGFAVGYWAVFVTIAAEQFGSNLRATVATTVPNFVRSMVIPIALVFAPMSKAYGIVTAAIVVGTITLGIAFNSAFRLKESYGVELDYLEE